MSKDTAVFIIEELLTRGSKFHYLDEESFSIGRSGEAGLQIEENGVSRVHVVVWVSNNQMFIEDQNSKNGTRVNEQAIYPSSPVPLQHGDIIQLGNYKLIKISLGPGATKASEVEPQSDLEFKGQSEEPNEDLEDKTTLDENMDPEKTDVSQVVHMIEEDSIERPPYYGKSSQSTVPSFGDGAGADWKSDAQNRKDIDAEESEYRPPLPPKAVEKPSIQFHEAQKVLGEANLIRGEAQKNSSELIREAQETANKLKREAEQSAKSITENAKRSAKEIIEKADLEAKDVTSRSEMAVDYARRELEEFVDKTEKARVSLADLNHEILGQESRKQELIEILANLTEERLQAESDLREKKQKLEEEVKQVERALRELKSEVAEKEEKLRDLMLECERVRRSAEKALEEEKRSVQAQLNSGVLTVEAERRCLRAEEDFNFLTTEIKKLESGILSLRSERDLQIEEIRKNRDEAEEHVKLLRAVTVEEIEAFKSLIEDEAFKLMDEAEAEVTKIADQLGRALEGKREVLRVEKEEFEKRRVELELESSSKAKEVMAEAQRQAEVVLKNAEKWADDNFNNSRRKAEEELERIRIEKRSLVEKAEEDLLKAQRESRSLLDESQMKAESVLRSAKDQAQAEWTKAAALAENELGTAREKARELLESAEAQVARRHKEAQEILSESQAKSEEQLEKAKKTAEELAVFSQRESDRLTEEAREKARQIFEETQRSLDQERTTWEERKRRIAEEVTSIREEAEAKTVEMTTSAQRKSETLLKKAQEEYDSKMQKLEAERKTAELEMTQERERVQKEAAQERERLLEQAKSEYNEQRRKDSLELSAFKMKQVDEAKERFKEAERENQFRRREEASEIAAAIDKAVLRRIQDIASKDVAPEVRDQISTEIQDVVKRILNDEALNDQEDLKKIMFFTSKSGWKARRFWRRMGYAGAVAASVIIFFTVFPLVFPQWSSKVVDLASSDKSIQERYVDEIRKQRENRPRYEPPQTDDFKNSYVENVLYTRDFVKIKTDKGFQERWISDLNKFFLDKLRLNESVIVNFISRENTLLKDLQMVQQSLQPATAEEGIKRMNDIEAIAIEDMKKILGGNLKIKKYKEFAASYYVSHQGKQGSAYEEEVPSQKTSSQSARKGLGEMKEKTEEGVAPPLKGEKQELSSSETEQDSSVKSPKNKKRQREEKILDTEVDQLDQLEQEIQ
ncbi:MAG: FHA domain-containing protein [Bdellovibrionales bacterium]|nr:FHA domain-containing protein [Bdellovibrionales bacterium]